MVNAGYNFNVESRKYEQKHIPLMNATNDDEMLKLILKSEIDVKVKDKYSKTLFQDRISAIPFLKKFISRRKNHSFKRIYKSVDLLLENGTDPNEMFNGMTPLMYQAKGYGHGRYFSLLLKYQANPNLQSVGKGETALMMVGDDAEKIEMLLDANADIYIQDFKGMTAIFHAIKRCQINKIKALMKKDENILESLDGNGKTALKYLRKQSRKKDCKKLKEFLVK